MNRELIDYHLNLQDPADRRRTQEAVGRDPVARDELARIRESLKPLASLLDRDPSPRDLCERTLARIDDWMANARAMTNRLSIFAVTACERQAGYCPPLFRRTDYAALLALALMAGIFLGPMLLCNSERARHLACLDAARQWYAQLSGSEPVRHCRELPIVLAQKDLLAISQHEVLELACQTTSVSQPPSEPIAKEIRPFGTFPRAERGSHHSLITWDESDRNGRTHQWMLLCSGQVAADYSLYRD